MTKLEFMHTIAERREAVRKMQEVMKLEGFKLLIYNTDILKGKYISDISKQIIDNPSEYLLDRLLYDNCQNKNDEDKNDCLTKIKEALSLYDMYYTHNNTLKLIEFLESKDIIFDVSEDDEYLNKLNKIKDLLKGEI